MGRLVEAGAVEDTLGGSPSVWGPFDVARLIPMVPVNYLLRINSS